jgi:HTH-type transcriptional regulator/antitoxin HipB
MDYPLRLADQLRAHLRALRKQRGLTQAQLGQRLGIGQVRIAEIEAKPGLVSVDQLIKLLSALDATLVLRDPGEKTSARASQSTAKKATRDKAPGLHIPPKKGSW